MPRPDPHPWRLPQVVQRPLLKGLPQDRAGGLHSGHHLRQNLPQNHFPTKNETSFFKNILNPGMSRKALREFREDWNTGGDSDLNLYLCTVYGGTIFWGEIALIGFVFLRGILQASASTHSSWSTADPDPSRRPLRWPPPSSPPWRRRRSQGCHRDTQHLSFLNWEKQPPWLSILESFHGKAKCIILQKCRLRPLVPAD